MQNAHAENLHALILLKRIEKTVAIVECNGNAQGQKQASNANGQPVIAAEGALHIPGALFFMFAKAAQFHGIADRFDPV